MSLKIKLTPALKSHFVKHFGVKEDASDAELKRVVSQKFLNGKILKSKLVELSNASDDSGKKTEKKSDSGKKTGKKGNSAKSGMSEKEISELVAKGIEDGLKKFNTDVSGRDDGTTITPTKLYSAGAKIRVKSATESYSFARKGAIVPNFRKDGTPNGRPDAGQPAMFMGRALDHPSDLDKACATAWLKWTIKHTHGTQDIPQCMRLTDHDTDLVMHALHNYEWTGAVKRETMEFSRKKLNEFEIKALLDDSISGGIEATPIVFDEAIVLIPVLYGELFPHVNVVNLPRGRRVKGAVQQNPTFTSGNQEGQAIQPFNTASFISAFDTAVNVAVGAMEIGLDFEEDSPVNIGSTILEKYGEKAMEWLDRVIAVGNGYNEPLGIFNTIGLNVLTSDNGIGGPPTVSDYEGMMFGVAKQFRNEAGAVTAFVANDTTYRRARAINVGPNDSRRVFGMTHADYMLLEKPYKVQNNIPNSYAAFVNLKRYRMYRRLGLTVRVETQGRALALSNTKLLVVRMRYGGQMELASAMSAIENMQL